jgi:hypothetical protein
MRPVPIILEHIVALRALGLGIKPTMGIHFQRSSSSAAMTKLPLGALGRR